MIKTAELSSERSNFFIRVWPSTLHSYGYDVGYLLGMHAGSRLGDAGIHTTSSSMGKTALKPTSSLITSIVPFLNPAFLARTYNKN